MKVRQRPRVIEVHRYPFNDQTTPQKFKDKVENGKIDKIDVKPGDWVIESNGTFIPVTDQQLRDFWDLDNPEEP